VTKKSPVHPGRILRETVLPEAGICVSEVALALGESEALLREILAEQKPMSAALCLKIAKLFNSTPEMWIRLQASYDLYQAQLDPTVAESLERIAPAQPRRVAVMERHSADLPIAPQICFS
jgi:addiction module HigA family antidote